MNKQKGLDILEIEFKHGRFYFHEVKKDFVHFIDIFLFNYMFYYLRIIITFRTPKFQSAIVSSQKVNEAVWISWLWDEVPNMYKIELVLTEWRVFKWKYIRSGVAYRICDNMHVRKNSAPFFYKPITNHTIIWVFEYKHLKIIMISIYFSCLAQSFVSVKRYVQKLVRQAQ